jgi:hypothetical protein
MGVPRLVHYYIPPRPTLPHARDGGLMITRRQLEANPAHHMQELNLQVGLGQGRKLPGAPRPCPRPVGAGERRSFLSGWEGAADCAFRGETRPGLTDRRGRQSGCEHQGVRPHAPTPHPIPPRQAIRPTNSDRFRHPLALLRLATFVRDAADVARTGRKSKWPLAVVGPDDGSGYCCVMGIRHKQLPRQPQVRAGRGGGRVGSVTGACGGPRRHCSPQHAARCAPLRASLACPLQGDSPV